MWKGPKAATGGGSLAGQGMHSRMKPHRTHLTSSKQGDEAFGDASHSDTEISEERMTR